MVANRQVTCAQLSFQPLPKASSLSPAFCLLSENRELKLMYHDTEIETYFSVNHFTLNVQLFQVFKQKP